MMPPRISFVFFIMNRAPNWNGIDFTTIAKKLQSRAQAKYTNYGLC